VIYTWVRQVLMDATAQPDEGLAVAPCSPLLALEPTLEEAFWSSGEVKQ
jgi:hypothetical protein